MPSGTSYPLTPGFNLGSGSQKPVVDDGIVVGDNTNNGGAIPTTAKQRQQRRDVDIRELLVPTKI